MDTALEIRGGLKHFPGGARLADQLVQAIFRGTSPADEDAALEGAEPHTVIAAGTWLIQVNHVTALAAGMDPARLDYPGGGRGADLARGYARTPGPFEVCCSYCGGLMLVALAHAAAALFSALHGDKAGWRWQELAASLIAPPPPPF